MNRSDWAALAPDLEFDRHLHAFESSGQRGPLALENFAPPPGHPRRDAILVELIRIDLELGWGQGRPTPLEDYLSQFPHLRSDRSLLRCVAWEEFRQRLAAGQTPDPVDYQRRYGIQPLPDGSTGILGAYDPEQATVLDFRLPGGFLLIGELGEGSFGRVFLAQDPSLADRRVVLKLTGQMPTKEAQTLARLQHTNIVPVYSAHQQGDTHLICMPYLGSCTLKHVLGRLAPMPRPQSGADLVRAASLPEIGPTPSLRDQLANRSYADAVLWIGAQLADGLAHAHERGVVHRDIKPANILLADDGRPMLLDFNLSGAANDGLMGGTLAYMAPEQMRAMQSPAVPVGPSADVYSLGLLLFEMLTGHHASLPQVESRESPPPPLSGVSPATAAIVRKCLDPNPDLRYPTGAELRDDLTRQLDSHPLRYAPDFSPRERVAKWSRRHPWTAGVLVATLLGTLVVGSALAAVNPWRQRVRRLEARAAVAALSETRDRVRPRVLADDASAEHWRSAQAELAAVLVNLENAPLHLLDVDQRQQADDVAGEALYYQARVLERLGRIEEALHHNQKAIQQFARGVPRPVGRQRSRLLERANRPAEEIPTEGTGSASMFLEAMGRLEEGDTAEAERLLQQLTQDAAPSATVWDALARTRMKRSDFAGALRAFDSAVALAPDFVWLTYGRAVCLIELGQYANARQDLDTFLKAHPDDAAARMDRAIVALREGKPSQALIQLDQVDAEHWPRAHFLRADAHERLGHAAAARLARQAGLKAQPTDKAGWCARGEGRCDADPRGALADFEAALALDPTFRAAAQNKAHLLSEQLGRPADALEVLDQLLKHHPRSVPARAGRAVLLARLGKAVEANKAADELLSLTSDPVALYQAGCVRLLTSDRPAAVQLLRRALRGDPSLARLMPGDGDLRLLHADSQFLDLLRAAARLDGR